MSRSSSSSAERDQMDEMEWTPSATASAIPPIPMPSLMSHPPLRLQRKPIPGTILKGLPGPSPPLPTPLPPISSPHDPSSLRASPQPFAPEEPPEEAMIPCPFCPAVFKKVGHLNRHTLKHTGTRFACQVPGCDKTFSRLDNMRTHMKNMHPPSPSPSSSPQAKSFVKNHNGYVPTNSSSRPTSSEQPRQTTYYRPVS